MYRPIKFTQPRPPKPFYIQQFGTINTSADGTQIADNESPDMDNITIDELGAIEKRTGYNRVFTTPLTGGKVYGMTHFKKIGGTTEIIFNQGGKLWKQSGTSQPTQIYASMVNNKTYFVSMNDYLYIMDGTNFLRYDGTNVVTTESVAYIPTLTVGRLATGGGTLYEAINLLQPAFKEKFSPDGTSKTFPLSLKGLDATTTTCTLGTTTKVEGTDYTVDRTNGTFTFTVVPTAGTNTLEFTAYKTISGNANKIKTCRMKPLLFGGTNDTRVFLGNSPTQPNYIWRSGLYDPTYWPDNTYSKIGSDYEMIMSHTRQYSQVIIHKENSKYRMTFELNASGVATFPVFSLNDTNGTIAADSVILIENDSFSLSRFGVYITTGRYVESEKDVTHISSEIDKLILNESTLSNTVSVDYDNKYMLAVNNKIYVCDYKHKYYDTVTQKIKFIWYPWSNIPASCFSVGDDGYLYFGSNTQGLIYKFKKKTDSTPYNDDGQAIVAYWKSKVLNFGTSNRYKKVRKFSATLHPSDKSQVDIYYIINNGQETFLKTKKMSVFKWSNWDWSNFSWLTSLFPQPINEDIKQRDVTYMQLIYKNAQLNSNMKITDTLIEFSISSEVKDNG